MPSNANASNEKDRIIATYNNLNESPENNAE